MTPQQFEEMYWLSFPEVVREMRPMLAKLNNDEVTLDEVQEYAFMLANRGYVIDPDVMRYGHSPYFETKRRMDQGYAWVPAFLEEKNYDAAPGITQLAPGWRPYDPNTPTKRHIKVSFDPRDWPSADPPAVVSVESVPAKPNFAVSFTPTKRAALVGDNSPAGTIYEGREGKWAKVVTFGPFVSIYWEVAK